MTDPSASTPPPSRERQVLEAMLRIKGESLPPELLDAMMSERAAKSPGQRDEAAHEDALALATSFLEKSSESARNAADDFSVALNNRVPWYTWVSLLGGFGALVAQYPRSHGTPLVHFPIWLVAINAVLTLAQAIILVRQIWHSIRNGAPSQSKVSLRLVGVLILVAQVVAFGIYAALRLLG